ALAMTAMDLGHGDGRGRWVVQVYGRRGECD
ncbi:DNA-binding protein, partial [Klebsiella pneumoniae]|nr:DNA-binding protein [Klebsiella pneumoniae]